MINFILLINLGVKSSLNEEGKPLSFKKILINQGHQTSLQYHQYKCETNLLLKVILILSIQTHLLMN